MIRRYGTPPKRGIRYRARPGAYAVLWREGAVLLTFQAEPEPEIQLPGGGIDPGESAIAALHREVWEETGWSIATPRRITTYRRFVYMPEYEMYAEKLCHIFEARPVMRLSDPIEPMHTALWMDPASALDAVQNPGDRDALAQVLGRISRRSGLI